MDEVEERALDLCKQYRGKFGVQIGYEEGWQISMEEFCQKLQDCIDTGTPYPHQQLPDNCRS